MTAWLTSVGAGIPQPAPEWFLWNEADSAALIYSPLIAKRLTRMASNPRSSVHLNDTSQGHDYVVVTGRLELAPGMSPASAHPSYADKYTPWMTRTFGSLERFSSIFSPTALPRQCLAYQQSRAEDRSTDDGPGVRGGHREFNPRVRAIHLLVVRPRP